MRNPLGSLLAGIAAGSIAWGAQPPSLSIQPTTEAALVRMRDAGIAPVAGAHYRVRLESSPDLRAWRDDGDWEVLDSAGGGLVVAAEPQRFFRFQASVQSGGEADGAEVFGYRRIFNEELQRVGFLSPAGFAAGQPDFGYLDTVGFDPRTADYWDQFQTAFPLNAAELAKFANNGFVVSERLGADRIATIYYRILSMDLPVFVTADSVLHAWHYSFKRLLEESEETQLQPALEAVLTQMAQGLAALPAAVRSGPLAESVADADYFLAVARSLLAGGLVPPAFGGDAEVRRTLQAIAAHQYDPAFPLFGASRPVDFSQFIVRGHYTRNVRLARYFQSFMWVARTDFRVLRAPGDPQSIRELGTAAVLANLLQSSGMLARWRELADTIRTFIGRGEAMNLGQLNALLRVVDAPPLESLTPVKLAALQAALYEGNYGEQLYASDVVYSPWDTAQAQLPAACVFLGQAFVPDGWAISRVIFDGIRWSEEIPNVTWHKKVLRRYASALDVAYTALGNRQTGDLIASRMLDASGIGRFRDGYPYAHNLVAATATFDRLPATAWEDSLYVRWLAALRELSQPTTDDRFPQAMRTRAWARHTLNTQLASYTELKHDTVLYAAQPYAQAVLCEYPVGYVQPLPGFWKRMKELAAAAAQALAWLPASGSVQVVDELGQPVRGIHGDVQWIDLAQRKQARIDFCRNFALQMSTLEVLADKELQQQPFTGAELDFLRSLMNNRDHEYLGPTFDGWYPGLFYKDYGQLLDPQFTEDSNGSNRPDPLITDIQTATPDEIDPAGGVLHEATGNINWLLLALDCGAEKVIYAGPTLSHYEFILPGPNLQRWSDADWTFSDWPAPPEWTTSYLVPK